MKRYLSVLLALVLLAGIAPFAQADTPPDFVLEWGTLGCCGLSAPDGSFYSPWALAVAPDGTVYVTDTQNNRIQKFTAAGGFLGKWDLLTGPRGIAVGPDGGIWVSDSANDRVVKFSSSGDLLLAIGSTGTAPGQFNFPWGIAVNAAGQVYVADNGNNRIQRFSPTGSFELQFGGTGTAPGQLLCPTGLVINAAGAVYVSDTCNSRVQKFSPAGFYQDHWGSFGSDPGEFSSNYGLALDVNGAVYVADSGNDRVQKFTAQGEYITEWNASVSGAFSRPTGVAVKPGDGVTLYVSDIGDHSVMQFAYAATAVPERDGLVPRPPLPLSVRPNPTLARSRVAFTLDPASAGALVRAEVFDPSGRILRVLAEGVLGAGEHVLSWDGRDASGVDAGAGVFFVQVTIDGRPSAAGRIVRLR